MGSESPLIEQLGQLGSCSPGSRSSLLSSGLFSSILCPILSQVPRRGRALPIFLQILALLCSLRRRKILEWQLFTKNVVPERKKGNRYELRLNHWFYHNKSDRYSHWTLSWLFKQGDSSLKAAFCSCLAHLRSNICRSDRWTRSRRSPSGRTRG